MTNNYESIAFKLDGNKKDIFDEDTDSEFSYNIDYHASSLIP